MSDAYLNRLKEVYEVIEMIREGEDECGHFFNSTDAIMRIDSILSRDGGLDFNKKKLNHLLK